MSSGKDSRGTSLNFAACAEAALGGEGRGSIVFLRNGLQSTALKSEYFRSVLVTAVRRAVRLLAVVEYSKEDSASSEVSYFSGFA